MDEENMTPEEETEEADIETEEADIGEAEFATAFSNEDGTKAVILTGIETDNDGYYVGTVEYDELQSYADDLFAGDDDVRNLQIGDIFEGDNAMEDAEDEAARLTDEFDPGEGASEDELADAVSSAKDDAGGFIGEEDLADINPSEFEEPGTVPAMPPMGGPEGPMPPEEGGGIMDQIEAAKKGV